MHMNESQRLKPNTIKDPMSSMIRFYNALGDSVDLNKNLKELCVCVSVCLCV